MRGNLKMRKIVDEKEFNRINTYWCSKHNSFHKKYRNVRIDGRFEKRKTKSFELCKDFACALSTSELFSKRFKNSWKSYNIKDHKQTYGSVKQ